MILISNHLLLLPGFTVPTHAVIRINMAWLSGPDALSAAIDMCGNHPVFLDFPQGRRKPPLPVWTLDEAVQAVWEYRTAYFAVSNVEDADKAHRIQSRLPPSTEMVPKIETVAGVFNLPVILTKLDCKHIMLDTEDLFTDDPNADHFTNAIQNVHQICASRGVETLRMYGVVFSAI